MKRFFRALFLSALLAGGAFFAASTFNAFSSSSPALSARLEYLLQQSVQRARAAAEPAGETAAGRADNAPLARYEKMLCDLANQERKKRGLRVLEIVPALAEVGRRHSREMMEKKYFAHESPTPALHTPMDRYEAKYGRSPRLVAENIYKLEAPPSYHFTPEDFRRAHDGWMKSPGHRANILREQPANGPTQIGVGIVVKNGTFWATQMFARP